MEAESDPRCEGCQTDTCFTPWPDDDPHMPGRMRGCFAGNARSIDKAIVQRRGVFGTKQKNEAGQFERQSVGEERPGGTFMPYLGPDGAKIPRKKFGEKRREYEGIRKRQLSDKSSTS